MKHNFLKIFVLISVVMLASCSFSYDDSSSKNQQPTSANYYFVSVVLTDNQFNQCLAKGLEVNKDFCDFTYQEAKDAIEIIKNCGTVINSDTGRREDVVEFFEQLEQYPNGLPDGKSKELERLDLKGNRLLFGYTTPKSYPYTIIVFYIQKV